MDKIKILMVLGNTRRGGTQAFIMNILRNIDRNRYQIDFALNLDFEGGWGPEMRSLGSELFILPVFKVFNWISYKRAWNDFLDERHYDIVHGHTTNSAGIYLNVAKQKGCRTIAHIHSTGFRGNFVERITKRFFSKLTKKYADYWFACSEKAAQLLYGEAYKSFPHYFEMPNAIDVKRFEYNENIRKRIRKELEVDDNTFLCGHVGTFSVPKNHSFVLDVFAEIVKKKPISKLLLIGEGVLLEPTKEKAEKLGILDKIVFRKNLKNVNEHMMAMDLFIFPSLFEGFGMVSLEAQATGLNVIQSDVIPKDTLLTECVLPMSLEQPASLWADKALTMSPKNRVEMNNKIVNTKYNLSRTVELITRLYSEMTRKE